MYLFLAMLGFRCRSGAFPWLWQVGATLELRCTGLWLQWRLLLWSTGSRTHWFQCWWLTGSAVGAPGLWTTRLRGRGTWDPPRSGIKPVSPALAGGLFTTEPPGKSSSERIFKRANPGSIYYLKWNTDFPLFSPGKEVELFISEEIALWLRKISWWAPFYINDAPSVLKDRLKKKAELKCSTLKISWHLGIGHWFLLVG